ncbi:MAG: hypothetical protein ABMA25_01640 [Ilumatobacteraceae bacterium]
MSNDELRASWRRTENHLDVALRGLVDQSDSKLAAYREWVSVNELGLALDALVDVAEIQGARRDVWLALRSAATEMRLHSKDNVHGPSVLRIDAQLQASR